jgi:urea transport system permease protein
LEPFSLRFCSILKLDSIDDMNPFWRLLVTVMLSTLAVQGTAAPLASADRLPLLQGLCSTDPVAALNRIVEVGAGEERAWSASIIESLGHGAFVCSPTRGPLVGSGDSLLNAVTLAPTDAPASPDESPLVPTIVLRRSLAVAAAQLDLGSADVKERRVAAALVNEAFANLNPVLVKSALDKEVDAIVRTDLATALAKRGLQSEDPAERLKAIAAVAEAPSEAGRTLLTNFLAADAASLDPASISAARSALKAIDGLLRLGHIASVLFSGLSYGGILLITALGLSIVFGLLGVINLAHGEFIMIGAYTTYVVEQLMQVYMPSFFGTYIFVAIPIAFLVCAVVGIVLEVCVIRFLYSRPLETLLATWAVSIAFIKAVQLAFGPQNVEFITPEFLNGGMGVFAGFFITWNRIFAIALALAIFAATYFLIRHTRLGLLIRATTQRRDTARSLGVAAESVDRLAFGLGAGLAGLAGVVLTQITSVNPSMGTSFVIDAFMVVVLGGAGSLVGTGVSSLFLGEINQFIEPLYGAVAAKVAVLLLIVLIIQRRPQGLFALKTRT